MRSSQTLKTEEKPEKNPLLLLWAIKHLQLQCGPIAAPFNLRA